MVFEISAAIITLVIVVLAVYLIKLIKDIQVFLLSTRKTMERLEIELASVKTEILPLIRSGSVIVDKTKEQMDNFDPLLKSVSHIGVYLNGLTSETPELFLKKRNPSWEDKVSDVLELASLGLKTFQQFQKRR